MSGSPYNTPYSGGGGGVGASVSQFPLYPQALGSNQIVSGTTGGTGGSTQITNSFFIGPMALPANLAYTKVGLQISHTTNGGTGSNSAAHMIGVYTLNGGTAMSLYTSFVWNMLVSQNSTTAQTFRWHWGTNSTSNSTQTNGNNVASNFVGWREAVMYSGSLQVLPPGQYWVAMAHSNRSSNSFVYSNVSAFFVSEQNTNQPLRLNMTSSAAPAPFVGVFTSTTNVSNTGLPFMPVSIHTSAITNNDATSRWQIPHVSFAGA